MMKNLSLATVVLLSTAACAGAQSTQPQTAQQQPTQNDGAGSQAKPSAYGSPYSGVAHPADTPILANTDDNAAATPAQTAVSPAPARSTYTAPAAQNPDDGIVTTPVADTVSSATANTPMPGFGATPLMTTPLLRLHSAEDPDAGIVTYVAGDPSQLPQGTPIHVRLVEELAANTITPGTPFTAQTTRDVVHMGNIVIPIGSYVHGRVTYVSAGRRIGGQSTMRLTPQEVVLPDGTHYQFRAIVTQTAGSNTRTDAEGYVINKDHPGRTAAEYGASAGGGAVVGALVGGPVGAGVGSAIGAGVMTVHWLREKNAAVLPANSLVTFGLSSPLMLTPSTMPASTSAYSSAPAAEAPVQPSAAYQEPKVVN